MANNNPNQPREDDAVLGGDAPPPVDSVVLGGIEGVKRRLASAAFEQRVAALGEALKYGQAGLDLVIEGLQDESRQVKLTAYSLLKQRQEPRVKQLLRKYLPWFEFDVVTVDEEGREINRNRSQSQFFEEDLGNGVTLVMVSIPGGRFLMGSPETETGRKNNESPQHQVTVAPFFMGKYPITQGEWQAVAALPQVRYYLEPEPSFFKGENLPVECVSWCDAVEFCARVSKKTGRKYRLPSEAQWEYACRAGTTTPFHFGGTITPNLANCRAGKTTPVGYFNIANAFGLYDMHGNVWEWCADPWHHNYEGAPTDGSTWSDNSDNYRNPNRLLRGGSWGYSPVSCRSACRLNYLPGDRLNFNIGFRVVCAAAWIS